MAIRVQMDVADAAALQSESVASPALPGPSVLPRLPGPAPKAGTGERPKAKAKSRAGTAPVKEALYVSA